MNSRMHFYLRVYFIHLYQSTSPYVTMYDITTSNAISESYAGKVKIIIFYFMEKNELKLNKPKITKCNPKVITQVKLSFIFP